MTFACGLARASAADPPDPKPPQVSVAFLFPPSPLIQAGKPRLVYEMRVTNYVPLTYTLDAIEVRAGSKTFSYAGETLTSTGAAPPLPVRRRDSAKASSTI
jgi:hypothetical protein